MPPADGFAVEPESDVWLGFESLPVEPLAGLELELELEPPAVSPESDDFELFGVRVADRSFFAQPDPLKWIAGVVKPFLSVPSAPQLGQKRGPGSWIPWITSVRWLQFEQT